MHSHETLLDAMGSVESTKPVERLKRLTILPIAVIRSLIVNCVQESWGLNDFAFRKVLSIRVALAIERKQYIIEDYKGNDTIIIHSGFVTETGFPLYLHFRENRNQDGPPLVLHTFLDEYSFMPSQPLPPPVFGWEAPALEPTTRVSMTFEHVLEERGHRLPFLMTMPKAAQKRCLEGAVLFGIRHELHQPYRYLDRFCQLVPVFLTSEDVTQRPDAAVALDCLNGQWKMRTWLMAEDFYPAARALVLRANELQPWLLSAWHTFTSESNHIDED